MEVFKEQKTFPAPARKELTLSGEGRPWCGPMVYLFYGVTEKDYHNLVSKNKT